MRSSGTDSAFLRRSTFVSFDGTVSCATLHQRPDRYRHLERDFARAPRIARGGGYSYSAASFGTGIIVQEMRAFDRLLAFDGDASLKVEAGASLAKLVAWAHPRGLNVPVLPGYPLITVGGCIAADVHGKNPLRDGTFADWVDAMTVYHPDRGYESITRTTHPTLFAATCGGFGLTGLIVDATLRLVPMPAQNVAVAKIPVGSLQDAVRVIADSRASDFAYSWHDGTARGPGFGRGIVFVGDWSADTKPFPAPSFRPTTAADRAALPFPLWNGLSARVANAVFRRISIASPHATKHVFEATFPFARQRAYHRWYGRRGFAEVQVLIPNGRFDDYVRGLRNLLERSAATLVMMSLKPFSGRQRSLSQTGDGMLMAMDFAREASTDHLLADLDALALDTGAQPNLAKDARLPARVASRTIPWFETFRERIAGIDPERLYRSELSCRLEL